MYLAQNSIFIAICMMLYVFDISIAVDEGGEPVVPDVDGSASFFAAGAAFAFVSYTSSPPCSFSLPSLPAPPPA